MARRLAIVLAGVLVFAAPAAGDNSGKISELEARIAAARAKESRLLGQIHDVTAEIRQLETRVGDVSQKLSILEHDLALHQRRLDRLNELASDLRRWALAVMPSANLVIVQTPAGFASPLAEAIDRAQLADVAGTIAGENTIFIAAREGITSAELATQLSHQLEGAT